jgi:3-methylfumaryl-CoA hydratase
MWAGGAMRFHGDLRIGDSIRRVSRIADVTAKEGRTGRLCFVTVDHLMEVKGSPQVRERQDIVYRELTPTKEMTPAKETARANEKTPTNEKTWPQPADAGRHQRRIEPTSALLFRYSALTFNSHRIHYDRPYAVDVEGYPGLVVHGPLQATLLFNFATEVRGAAPERFTFRSMSPLFDDCEFLLHASEEGETLRLWTARRGGPVAMTAEADFA